MRDLKYTQILNKNKELEDTLKDSPHYTIKVLSNTVVNPIKDVLEYALRAESIFAKVSFGDYDNIIQESYTCEDSKTVVVFWEISNLIDGFQHDAELMTNNELLSIIEKTKSEIDILLQNLQSNSLILFNLFCSFPFSRDFTKSNFKTITNELNSYLKGKTQSNLRVVDLFEATSDIGLSNCFDYRYFYSSKSLYTLDFYKNYVEHIKWFILSSMGKMKKAIIFDCDNTLWSGILGEDGFAGIKMSKSDKTGKIFNEIQSIALALSKRGVIVGLCSKNNEDDVNNVINNHADFIINDSDIVIKRINWNNKASNLKEIANDLNIGLNSIVFVDDSSFEVELVRTELPEVKVVQVPKKIYEYPIAIRSILNYFYNPTQTAEDLSKSQMYKQQADRSNHKKQFVSIEDYLKSLELELNVSVNNQSNVARVAQMTQKTNQFNLTTKRYTESEIQNFLEDKSCSIITISVNDKFGNHGITGAAILTNLSGTNAIIDSLLMSCRIIGRNIEYVFMDYIMNWCKNKDIRTINASYIKTLKNDQVKDFYNKCSYAEVTSSDSQTEYVINIDDYKKSTIEYIKIK